MLKLLRNYIREQKHSLLQVFGLGFLVIIMTVAFLALNFSNAYIKDQYFNHITHNTFHQYIKFPTPDNSDFKGKNEKKYDDSWLENINYYKNDDSINQDKFKLATFQLTKLDDKKHLYRFTFNGGAADKKGYFAIGNKLAQQTGESFVDFKLNLPSNYPDYVTHEATLDKYATLIDNYVYDKNNPSNETNFMITSNEALKYYHDKFYNHSVPYATRDYQASDIHNEAILYTFLIQGMLYPHLERNFVTIVNDLLITGKSFAFIQTDPKNLLNTPIIIKGNSLINQPLQNNEILIYEQFAKINHLKIGQDYIIAGQVFKIRGFATSSFATYPNLYFPGFPNFKNNTIAIANNWTLNKVNSDLKPFIYRKENNFQTLDPELGVKNIDPKINNTWIYNFLHQNFKPSPTYPVMFANGINFNMLISPLDTNVGEINNSAYESGSLNFINDRTSVMDQIGGLFLSLIFIVTVIIIFIIIFKMIDRNKRLIGVLKATGYKSWQLSITLIIAIITPLLFFAIAGVLTAIPVGYFITTTYQSSLALINFGWYFNFVTAILLIVIPVLGLIIISFFLIWFLLRTKPLDLINNSRSKKSYNLGVSTIFVFVAQKLTKNLSYKNKLAATTATRSFGKTLLMCFTSLFGATLVFFALASSGLINNILGLQYGGINFNYQNNYEFDTTTKINFINTNNKLSYNFENTHDIKTKPSIYPELIVDLQNLSMNPGIHIQIDFRNRYIMGSELLKLRQKVEPILTTLPQGFQDFWKKNLILIDYLTNKNGQHQPDLIISFGTIPYEKTIENPYTSLSFQYPNLIDLNNPANFNCSYDNNTNTLSKDCFSLLAPGRTAYGVNQNSTEFLKPNFVLGNFNYFTTLNYKTIANSSRTQDIIFMQQRQNLINKLGIKDPDTSAVQFIPIAASNRPGGDGNQIGKTTLYSYEGLDKQEKYIIGIVNSVFTALPPDTILLPQQWINKIIFGQNNNLLTTNNFANAKFSKFTDNEFKHYLPIISKNNDYTIDFSQLSNSKYLTQKNISTALSSLIDIKILKETIQISQYSLQAVISFFGIFSVILSLLIVMIVTNITVRDNLILINILRSLGYNSIEVSYNFWMITIPLIVVSSLISVFIVPVLVSILATIISTFASVPFVMVYKWWYFASMLLINIVIYLISYAITWKLNINNKQLMKLTK